MGDPVTIALIGTGLSGVGAIQQGQAARAAGEYNANLARQNAQQAREQAAAQEVAFRREARKAFGTGEVAVATQGGRGSPMDALFEFALVSERDALNIRFGGDAQARAFEAEARLSELTGKSQQQASYYSAAGELLSGGARAYSMANPKPPKAG